MKTKVKMFVTLLSVAALALVAGNAFALTGACVDCHTMHNSQDGGSMNFDLSPTPNAMLLKAGTCSGCHADATALGLGIPQVDMTTNYLAGGSFAFVTSIGEETGHNVSDLALLKDTAFVAISDEPPGFDSTAPVVGIDWAGNQLTCAGVYGCHGDHNQDDIFAAVKGAHHDNAGGNLATADTVGNSYRFLKGIKGGESIDWEANPTASSHNVYYGAARTTTDADPTDTISALCAQCHGKFHTAVDIVSTPTNMSSPWVRHPTDINMRTIAGEYAAYAYSTDAPVALSALPESLTDASYVSEAVVTCISCHRAHGSENADLLRWSYTGMIAGTDNTTGCFYCHTAKDGNETNTPATNW